MTARIVDRGSAAAVEPYCMTYDKAAKHFDCSRTRLEGWLRDGKIRAVKAGRRTLLITRTVREHIDVLPSARD